MHGWHDPKTIKGYSGLTACCSVGYLTRLDRVVVQLAQSRHDLGKEPDNADRWADALSIPRSQVQRIRLLR